MGIADWAWTRSAIRSSTPAGWRSQDGRPGRSSRPGDPASRQPDLVSRTELVFAGPLSGDERHQIEAAGKDGSVRAVGTLARQETCDSRARLTLSCSSQGAVDGASDGEALRVSGRRSADSGAWRRLGGRAHSERDRQWVGRRCGRSQRDRRCPGGGRPASEDRRWPNEAAGRYSYVRIAAGLSDHVQRWVAPATGS